MITTLQKFTPNDTYYNAEYFFSFENQAEYLKRGTWEDVKEVEFEEKSRSIVSIPIVRIGDMWFSAQSLGSKHSIEEQQKVW